MSEKLSKKAQEVFSLFSPFIRDYIYRSGWNELREVQVEAASILFFGDENLLISSETSSGKTEAAFFPVLSRMEEMGPESCMALYISPLKALINDQYSRMEDLLRESSMPVFRWHGDVSRSQKEKFLKDPKGVLQITPESLESMLCRRSNDIPRLFGNVQFVILDEIHALIGSDRGSQILCQLQRIGRLCGHFARRIALSATVGDPEKSADWLGKGSGRKTKSIVIPKEKISWRLGLEHFYTTETAEKGSQDPASEMIYKASKGAKCVVFSNSREETEEICATLRLIAKRRGEEDRFYIHHGNLSAAIREDTENALKNKDEAITACATVTLELGIDIGKLKRILNQGAPTSVSGFLQRIGRSGRRGEDPEMMMIFREEEALPNAPVYQIIPWELLQGIAIVELYLKERWVEPARQKPFPASLLFHQTLSLIASKGSLTPSRLAHEILSMPPFSHVSEEEYRELLLDMLKKDFLEQTEEKDLIIGIKGEKILQSFKFFAVFKDSEDFTVRCGSEEIGTISSTPPVGERFALAGRVWEVEEVNVQNRLVYVKAVEGKMKISWPGDVGEIHTRILEKMREVLTSNEDYPYLLPGAKARLEKARRLAQNTQLAEKSFLCLWGDSYVFFPWVGTRAFRTIKRILQRGIGGRSVLGKVESGGCYYITFRMEKDDPVTLVKKLSDYLDSGEFTLSSLIGKTEVPLYDKYDAYLPASILQRSYAENFLEIREVENKICELKKELL